MIFQIYSSPPDCNTTHIVDDHLLWDNEILVCEGNSMSELSRLVGCRVDNSWRANTRICLKSNNSISLEIRCKSNQPGLKIRKFKEIVDHENDAWFDFYIPGGKRGKAQNIPISDESREFLSKKCFMTNILHVLQRENPVIKQIVDYIQKR